jgi:hypothetical protein
MEWDREAVSRLQLLFLRKHVEMGAKHKTDRRNFSAIWNRYLAGYDATLLGDKPSGKVSKSGEMVANRLLLSLVNMVNFDNCKVASGLVIDNPDRPGQYIVLQREIAERIMVLGLL